MEVISVVPRGYCQGVVRAIRIAQKTVEEYPDKKISMLGMIVHNHFVVEECRRLGIICLENKKMSRLQLLDEIDEGVVIFTAHGVSDDVVSKAKQKGLIIVDATCPDVMKTHEIVREHIRQNGEVIYIGKQHHPEAEGVCSLSEHVHLISELSDIDRLGALTNVLITNQTTLSLLDTDVLVKACCRKYPDAEVIPEICNATTIRQKAVMNLKNVDTLIVVGDPHSNNSNQLKEIGIRSGIKNAYLVESPLDLDENMLKGADRLAVTSGSSTPNSLTSEVIRIIQQYADTGILSPVTVDRYPVL